MQIFHGIFFFLSMISNIIFTRKQLEFRNTELAILRVNHL